MNIKPEVLAALLGLGMTTDEIGEFAARLVANAQAMEEAAANAQRQLDFNESERVGLMQTLADARANAARTRAFLAKVVEPEVVVS